MAKSIFPKEMLEESNGLNPEKILGTFLGLQNQARYNHLNTTGFAEHKALNELYDALDEYEDDVMERILGNQAPQRLGAVSPPKIVPGKSSLLLAEEVIAFARDLEEWAEQHSFCEIENLAQELVGVGTKTKYLLSLS